jgi:hypothetical protein
VDLDLDIIAVGLLRALPRRRRPINPSYLNSSLLKTADAFLAAQFAAGKVSSFLPEKIQFAELDIMRVPVPR